MVYNPIVLNHFHKPRNTGSLDSPDATGTAGTPGHGNYMVLQLSVSSGSIDEARFLTYGCPGAIACGSALTELCLGKLIDKARQVSAADVERYLGGLPLGKRHCAQLAVDALHCALRNLP